MRYTYRRTFTGFYYHTREREKENVSIRKSNKTCLPVFVSATQGLARRVGEKKPKQFAFVISGFIFRRADSFGYLSAAQGFVRSHRNGACRIIRHICRHRKNKSSSRTRRTEMNDNHII